MHVTFKQKPISCFPVKIYFPENNFHRDGEFIWNTPQGTNMNIILFSSEVINKASKSFHVSKFYFEDMFNKMWIWITPEITKSLFFF